MAEPFEATVRSVHVLGDRLVLVLEEDHRGDIVVDDEVEVTLPDGGSAVTRVRDLAWGSAYRADEAPLSLVVDRIAPVGPVAGAKVRPTHVG